MKYIRTNEMVYKKERIVITHELPLLDRKGDGKLYVNETLILKEADTIDELCDAWIIVPIRVNCNPFVRHISENISHFINSSHVIFAGIWTKGKHDEPILKPVAKMNEKGDLELL